MKSFGIFILTAALWGSNAFADGCTLYICFPDKPTPLVSQVIVDQATAGKFLITIVKEDALGETTAQSGEATYYDDMTYIGYYSETLNASIELDYPNWHDAAILYIGDERVRVSCRE